MEPHGRSAGSAGARFVAALQRGVGRGAGRRAAQEPLEDGRLQGVGVDNFDVPTTPAPPSTSRRIPMPSASGVRRFFGLSRKMSLVVPVSEGKEPLGQPLEFEEISDIALKQNWHVVDISGAPKPSAEGIQSPATSSAMPQVPEGCTAVVLYCDSTRIDVALRSVAYIRWDAHRRRTPLPPLLALVSDLWVGCEEVERMFVMQGVQQLCQAVDPIDDVIQNCTTEGDLTLSVMLSLTRLSRFRRPLQSQAVGGVSHSEGTVSFFISQSSAGDDFMVPSTSALPSLQRITEREPRVERRDAEVNTLLAMEAFKPPAERQDAEVNTNIVMDGFEFRCAVCSKPPKAPKPTVSQSSNDMIAPVDLRALEERKNRLKKKKAQRKTPNMKVYAGSKFNGEWEAFPPEGKEVNEWLRMFTIVGGDVLLGDQSYVNLMQDEEERLWIYGGELVSMPTADMFIRRGRGGVDIAFVKRAGISEQDLRGSIWSERTSAPERNSELTVEQLTQMCEEDDGCRSEVSECPSLASLMDIGP